MHPYLDGQSGPIGFAHRGGASAGAENTMAAFDRAVRLGYRFLETDVHVSADGVLVVFHDDDTRRLTGEPGTIGGRTWSQVERLRVDGEPIPRLEDLLTAWPDMRLNIDVKTDAALEPTVAAVNRPGVAERVLLASDKGRRVVRIRELAPRMATSVTPWDLTRLRLAGRKPAGGIAAQVPVRHKGLTVVTPRFIETARAYGIAVHVWTIDDATEMRRLLDLGVDGIMTDRLDVLCDVYRERGLWQP